MGCFLPSYIFRYAQKAFELMCIHDGGHEGNNLLCIYLKTFKSVLLQLLQESGKSMKLNDAVEELLRFSRKEVRRNELHREEVDQEYKRAGDIAITQWEPTDEIAGFPVRPGDYTINGATEFPGGVNFTLYSIGATACELLLFHRKEEEPFAVIPIPDDFRVGKVWSIMVFGLNVEEFEYSYRLDGPWDPENGDYFNKKQEILDPYAKAVVGQRKWGQPRVKGRGYHARVVKNNFRWDTSEFPNTKMEDSIIYEMHVRGFTRHGSSGVTYPGTFAGIIEKIPYLKELGVTAVELMPIFEFDEVANGHVYKGKQLYEYWGYNTVAFFAPNTSYAASAEYDREGRELKEMIQLLKENGIEVILDVVFNHTAEGDENGPFISFRGLDNKIYYMLTPDGKYYNFSGCGNTVNCNHPIVQEFIIECLRYWVTRYHIDGFRFDLASILGRAEDGSPMEDPPLLKRLANDPILGNAKLIAEAWDAGGMYQVGSFPAYNRWAEWNGRYRDTMRDFLKGSFWTAEEAANRITGSLDMYYSVYMGYTSSINFLTCHDGYTLYDLYSYNQKHNEANGWNNSDGSNDNRSWNCGVEGETDDTLVKSLRFRMMRNAITVLMCSRGTPMILAGDEFGNTQFGNNNCYCQDNEYSWLDWTLLEKNRTYFEFYRDVIAFRKLHPSISRELPRAKCGLEDVTVNNGHPGNYRIDADTKMLGIQYAGYVEEKDADDIVYVLINPYWEGQNVHLPWLPEGLAWGLCIDTAAPDGFQYHDWPQFMDRPLAHIEARSVKVFTSVKKRNDAASVLGGRHNLQ